MPFQYLTLCEQTSSLYSWVGDWWRITLPHSQLSCFLVYKTYLIPSTSRSLFNSRKQKFLDCGWHVCCVYTLLLNCIWMLKCNPSAYFPALLDQGSKLRDAMVVSAMKSSPDMEIELNKMSPFIERDNFKAPTKWVWIGGSESQAPNHKFWSFIWKTVNTEIHRMCFRINLRWNHYIIQLGS